MIKKPKKLYIIKEPDSLLRFVSTHVTDFNDDLAELSENMLETMYQSKGIGLAAIQVGKPICLVVIDISYKVKKTPFKKLILNKKPIIMINPVIIEEEGVQYYKEGCLSIPNVFATVQRAKAIKVKYQDLTGKEQILNAEGKLAVVVAHELDHLDGNLFIDKVYDPKGEDNAESFNSTII